MHTSRVSVATRRLSEIHRQLHEDTLAIARRVRKDGAQHARLMQLMAVSRQYFARFRKLGD